MSDFLNLLIDTGWLQAQFDTHPRDMWAFTAFVFALGLASGAGMTIVGGWVKTRREAKIRALELEHELLMERERAESEERKSVERLRCLPPQLKSMLKEMYDNGTVKYAYALPESDYAVSMMEMGLTYSVSSNVRTCEYMVTPDAASLIRAHYDEIFD